MPRHRSPSFVLVAAAATLPTLLPAQALHVGDPAPAIQCSDWVNWDGAAPTLESLRGRVVLIEFWGTWCGPCVRAMPGIQKLHDRYGERGLTVLAISYETPAKMKPFLQQNAYTMPVGSDPEKRTVTPYGVSGWPMTVVVGKDGTIAHVGSPYDAEAVVEKALGLEAGPAAVLDAYCESLGAKKDELRAALQRLVEKAPPDFDLRAWALSHVPPATVREGDAPAPDESGAAARPAAGDADELLRKCLQAWRGNAATREALLRQLAAAAPTQFDLAAFAQATYGKTFPFDAGDLATLLKAKKYGEVVDALATRAPAASVLAAAAKNADLAAYSRTKEPEARSFAKKGLMAELWVFAGAPLPDEQKNSEFWSELSVSGMATSEDKKQITGILLGGEMLKREHANAFVGQKLAAALLMADLARKKAPNVRDLPQLVQKERQALVRDLEQRYGKPQPVAPK